MTLSDRAASTQELVRDTMGNVGGYWRPLAAVARLLEELGELGESLARFRESSGERASELADLAWELADLWIITAALADQFLGEVAEPGSHLGRDRISRDPLAEPVSNRQQARLSDDSFAELVRAAARIARIVNYYDGPKTPRTLDGWVSLSDAVAEFHAVLADTAHAHGVDLGRAVSEKLHAIPVRDSKRFSAVHHNPGAAPCLQAFRLTAAIGSRPAIAAARLWGAPAWMPARSLQANVERLLPTLLSFTKAATLEGLDAYVIPGPPCASPELLAEWREQLLRAIEQHDPAPREGAFAQRSSTGAFLVLASSETFAALLASAEDAA